MIEREVTGLVDTGFSLPRLLSTAGLFVVSYHDELTYVFSITAGQSVTCLARRAGFMNPFYSAAFSHDRWAVAGSLVVTGAWPITAGQEDIRVVTAPNLDELNDVGSMGNGLFVRGYGWDKHLRLWTWQPGGEVELLTEQQVEEDHCCGSADGGQIAWLRGDERYEEAGVFYWNKVELLTHPLPIGQVPISGTVVRQVPQNLIGNSGVLSAGHWASFGQDPDTGKEFVYLVRISDGQLWKIPPRGPDVYWISVIYLSSEEVALLEKSHGTHTPTAKTIVRYELASLGPGEPAE